MRVMILKTTSLKGRIVLLFLVFTLFIFLFYLCVHNIVERMNSIELYSENFPGKVIVKDRQVLKRIQKEISGAQASAYKGNTDKKFVLVVKKKNQTQVFWIIGPGQLFEVRSGKIYKLGDKGRCLEDALRELEQKSPYGEFLTWNEVKNIFKKFDIAKVTDFETGMSFNVQRRAGSQHADVQPLTAEDSDTMKLIYGGRWSWKRRAVIVETGGHRIAGSMNGMPHGAGAINGNKFKGHFCIHFRDSKLHSKREDPAHQLMIWKAAGVIEKVMANSDSQTVSRVMLAALEQGDVNLALRFIETSSGAEKAELTKKLRSVRWIAVARAPGQKAEKDDQSNSPKANDNDSDKGADLYSTKISYKLTDGTEYKNRRLTFHVVKAKGPIPLKVSSQDVLHLFNQPEKSEEDKEEESEETYNEGQFYMEL